MNWKSHLQKHPFRKTSASEINIRCKELSLTTPRLQKIHHQEIGFNSCISCSANKNFGKINPSDIFLKILKR